MRALLTQINQITFYRVDFALIILFLAMTTASRRRLLLNNHDFGSGFVLGGKKKVSLFRSVGPNMMECKTSPVTETQDKWKVAVVPATHQKIFTH